MHKIIEILKVVSKFILDFLKNFSVVLIKDKIQIIALVIAIIAFFIILISAALN